MSWLDAFLHPRPGTRGEIQAAFIALLASVAVGSLMMLVAGVAPGRVWLAMFERTAGDPYLIGQVLYKATALALCGLAVALALDAGLFNIGAEGQLTAGVLACAGLGAALPAGTPAVFAVPLCLAAAAGAGAVIGGLIGALRATRGAHEVITSIMLNAIVAGVALWIGNAVVFEGGTTRGAEIAPGAQLPELGLGGSPANAALVLAIGAVLGVRWLRERTTWGQAWRAVGRDPDAARSAGISVARVQTLVMVGSGALAGLAAANFVMGHKHAFEEGLGRGTGFLAISAALLGRASPLGVAFAALVLAFLSSGGPAVADLVPKELTELLQGGVVPAVAASGPWVRRRTEAEEQARAEATLARARAAREASEATEAAGAISSSEQDTSSEPTESRTSSQPSTSSGSAPGASSASSASDESSASSGSEPSASSASDESSASSGSEPDASSASDESSASSGSEPSASSASDESSASSGSDEPSASSGSDESSASSASERGASSASESGASSGSEPGTSSASEPGASSGSGESSKSDTSSGSSSGGEGGA